MQRRDILQEQIEKIGKVLNNALAILLGDGNTVEPIVLDQVRQNLKQELDWDIADTLKLSFEAFEDYIAQRDLPPAHLELLAKIYTQKGKWTVQKAVQALHYQKAIELLTLADKRSQEFSWERMNMRNRLEDLL